MDSTGADEHALPRRITATGAKSAARTSRKVNTETKAGKCILSDDVEIEGSITFQKELLIDGKVQGQIISDGVLTIGENAKIRGEIQTKSVTVHDGDARDFRFAADQIQEANHRRFRIDHRFVHVKSPPLIPVG